MGNVYLIGAAATAAQRATLIAQLSAQLSSKQPGTVQAYNLSARIAALKAGMSGSVKAEAWAEEPYKSAWESGVLVRQAASTAEAQVAAGGIAAGLGTTFRGALGEAESDVAGLGVDPKVALAVGIGALAGAGATAYAIRRRRRSTRSTGRRSGSSGSRRRGAARQRKAQHRRRGGPGRGHGRNRRGGAVKDRYHGKRVYVTKRGQPYVLMANGKARFVRR